MESYPSSSVIDMENSSHDSEIAKDVSNEPLLSKQAMESHNPSHASQSSHQKQSPMKVLFLRALLGADMYWQETIGVLLLDHLQFLGVLWRWAGWSWPVWIYGWIQFSLVFSLDFLAHRTTIGESPGSSSLWPSAAEGLYNAAYLWVWSSMPLWLLSIWFFFDKWDRTWRYFYEVERLLLNAAYFLYLPYAVHLIRYTLCHNTSGISEFKCEALCLSSDSNYTVCLARQAFSGIIGWTFLIGFPYILKRFEDGALIRPPSSTPASVSSPSIKFKAYADHSSHSSAFGEAISTSSSDVHEQYLQQRELEHILHLSDAYRTLRIHVTSPFHSSSSTTTSSSQSFCSSLVSPGGLYHRPLLCILKLVLILIDSFAARNPASIETDDSRQTMRELSSALCLALFGLSTLYLALWRRPYRIRRLNVFLGFSFGTHMLTSLFGYFQASRARSPLLVDSAMIWWLAACVFGGLSVLLFVIILPAAYQQLKIRSERRKGVRKPGQGLVGWPVNYIMVEEVMEGYSHFVECLRASDAIMKRGYPLADEMLSLAKQAKQYWTQAAAEGHPLQHSLRAAAEDLMVRYEQVICGDVLFESIPGEKFEENESMDEREEKPSWRELIPWKSHNVNKRNGNGLFSRRRQQWTLSNTVSAAARAATSMNHQSSYKSSHNAEEGEEEEALLYALRRRMDRRRVDFLLMDRRVKRGLLKLTAVRAFLSLLKSKKVAAIPPLIQVDSMDQ